MIYLIKSNNYLKIGYTKDISDRMLAYTTHNPEYILLAYRGGNMQAENLLHTLLSDYFIDNTEWMRYDDFILKMFNNIKLPSNFLSDSETNEIFSFYENFDNIDDSIIVSNLHKFKSVNALKIFIWMNAHKSNNNICYLTTKTRSKLLLDLKISSNTLTNNLKVLKDMNMIEGEKGEFIINRN